MKKDSVYDIVTRKIINKIESGTIPWQKPWYTNPPQNIKGRAYTGINKLLLACNEYEHPYYLTMKQCNELDGKVNKGEHGHIIVFWKMIEGKDTKINGVTKMIPLLRYYYVFNISQTNIPLSIVKSEQIKLIRDEIGDTENATLESFVGKLHDLPIITNGGSTAAYIPKSDQINIPVKKSFVSDISYYQVLFHEIIHSTGAENRLNRPEIKTVQFGSETYSKEELIAEIGSCFLCNVANIEIPVDRSAAYMKGWLRALRNDTTMIIHAAGAAEKAVSFLIRKKETTE